MDSNGTKFILIRKAILILWFLQISWEFFIFKENSFHISFTHTVISLSGKFPAYIMLFTLENPYNVVFLKSFLLMSPIYDVIIYKIKMVIKLD